VNTQAFVKIKMNGSNLLIVLSSVFFKKILIFLVRTFFSIREEINDQIIFNNLWFKWFLILN
jgi:hypothetical protein